MEPLLLVGYSAVFLALIMYVGYLRNRITALEEQVSDLVDQ
ncbi:MULTISPECIES: CcmD family protein [unclassified Haloarcula]|nr:MULTISPECIES: CcmD family protein [Haloarcula]